jgi:polysaccharide export outer membrane protein
MASRAQILRAAWAGLLVLGLFAAEWARAQTAAPARPAAAAGAAARPAAAAATAPATVPSTAAEYRLGAGDVVKINVFQNPDLSIESRLSDAGSISYPLLGNVVLGGLTVGEAEKRIADGLRTGGFVRQPQVSVLLMQVRGSQVSVLGHVNRPGRFPIEAGELRLTELLALAGGIAQTGGDVVVVVGTRNGQPMRVEVDVPTSFGTGGRTDDLLLQAGDTVWVDRAPMVYIYGQVQRPGAMRLERDMTLLQALASGGGLTLRGTEKGIRVHRRGGDGQVQVLELPMDQKLLSGDVVYVRESIF